jgi:ferric-dicitrate binding protein FerR (iron transport regulator)
MNNKNTNDNINTDEAWLRLHSRLTRDGLLPLRRRFPLVQSIAAAACIAAAIILIHIIYTGSGAQEIHSFMLDNEEGTSTLVSTLEDGSTVYLGQGSGMNFTWNSSEHVRRVQLHGNAMFEVAPDAGNPFTVETEMMLIEVTGTSFDVECADNSLAVLSGRVKAMPRGKSSAIYVDAGETAHIHSGQISRERTTDTSRFSRYSGRISFRNEKLGDILGIINRRGEGITLVADDPELSGRRITVTFDGSDTAADIAQLVCSAFNLNMEDAGKGRIRLFLRH